MPVKEFTVGFSRTINLGNFESARIEASVTMDVRDDAVEKPEAVAQYILRGLLETTYREQMKKRKDAA